MPDTGFVAVFLIGLLGGVHCVGMCGGIVSALSAHAARGAGSVRVHAPGATSAAAVVGAGMGMSTLPLQLAYNLGRIASYIVAGALVGAVGSYGLLLENILPVQLTLYVAANLMLVALGFYLTGFTRSLAFTERIGALLWRRVQPLTRRFLPAAGEPMRAAQAWPLGLLWGWLPCGMVYSVLTVALLSGSALRGGATMLAFGLGTLPNLLLAGLLLQRLRAVVQARYVRLGSGVLVAGFGLWGLLNATSLGGRLWAGVVCLV